MDTVGLTVTATELSLADSNDTCKILRSQWMISNHYRHGLRVPIDAVGPAEAALLGRVRSGHGLQAA